MIQTLCPQGVILNIDGKTSPDKAPNPFQGYENPDLRNQDGFLIIGLNTEENGFFELFDFDVKNLAVGTFNGEKFKVRLSFSPSISNAESCTSRKTSKFIIEEYNAELNKLVGCFYGKLDCEKQHVEINAAVSGTIF
ncbi:MAG: hypothetical protein KAI17_16720 [Thiotrichaceae bacterium]|nr:hypothetical protein [Thiotrichaceae bacterium]